jgi:hypothetical protein
MVIAVDFDGTIVMHEYPKIGKEIPFAIETLKKIQTDLHHQLVLWTVREGKELEEAIEYCRKKGLEFYAVNNNYPEETPETQESRKLNAELFIDDKNLGGLPDWGVIYNMIASENPFAPIRPTTTLDMPDRKKGFFQRLFG